ncbi:MAG: hypothetical protein DI626_06440 [Micavibrio aeruginosavorus]|uniref:glucan 1,4-alpha-glucosidase n=1 Tax=Micavibrio aeruginosavorus TaxID=349221 RepID=A0A2W4ZZU4_9BACT|nr:MAG: hypothetical protein DI626_06440 [Micavibrio aeruginosavorus]
MAPSSLDHWIDRQRSLSLSHLKASLSATHLSHTRKAFAQTVRPACGSVLASPVSAHWDPEPDYFYHWVRDAAIVMNAVVEVARHAKDNEEKQKWLDAFDDYIDFSLRCTETGAVPLAENPLLAQTVSGARQFLRTTEDIAGLNEETVLKEPRFNPDGTLDLLQWAKPQYDGPALRALTSLNYIRLSREQGRPITPQLVTLLKKDLDFTVSHADEPCIGPWEEDHEMDQHYFTSLCQLGAIYHGKEWIEGKQADAATEKLYKGLDSHWDETRGLYISLRQARAGFDAGQFMAALHADLPGSRHSLQDPKLLKTVSAMEDYFARAYPLNAGAASVVIGRSERDKYFGNNPWFPTTLSLAEFYYKMAERSERFAGQYVDKAENILKAVLPHVPKDGSLSEQFDRASGHPVSARHLTWSYAAFLCATQAREQALSAPDRNNGPMPGIIPALF